MKILMILKCHQFNLHANCFLIIQQIDKGMMDELKEVKKVLNPTEILLVVDAMTGQEAAGTWISNFLLKRCHFLFFFIYLFFIDIMAFYSKNLNSLVFLVYIVHKVLAKLSS